MVWLVFSTEEYHCFINTFPTPARLSSMAPDTGSSRFNCVALQGGEREGERKRERESKGSGQN